MKIAEPNLELQALLSVVRNSESGRDQLALRLMGDLEPDYFGYEPCGEIFKRLQRLTKKGKSIPSLRALQTDTSLSEPARLLLQDPAVKPLRKESDADMMLENLQRYHKLRLLRTSSKSLARTLKEANGVHDVDFEAITTHQSELIAGLRGKADSRKALLHVGAQSNSVDLTDEILSDEDDFDTIYTGFDYFDKESGGFRRGQFLVLASHRKGGKCASPETLIETERGLIPLGELFDGTEKDDTFVETRIKLAHRYGITETSHRYTKMHSSSVSIRSERGYELKGSKVHPVLVLDPATKTLDYKRMKDLKQGDFIVLNRKHHIFPTEPLQIRWKYQPKPYSPEVRLSCAYCDYKGTDLAVHLGKAHPSVDQQRYLRKRHSQYKRWPQHKRGSSTAASYAVPSHMTKDLATVLGYLVSEGSLEPHLNYCNFQQSDAEVFQDFCDAFKRCFPDAPLRIKRGACNVAMVGSIYVRRYLQHLGLMFGHSREQDVPWSILRSTRECVQAFLRAYYEGDGGVEKNRMVCASSASVRLLKTIQQLLLRFSIVSQRYSRMKCATNGSKTMRPYEHLEISKANAATFIREIGFVSARKNKALKVSTCKRAETVPLVSAVANKLKAKHAIPGSQGFYRLPNGGRKRMILQPQDCNDCTSEFLTKKRPRLLDGIAHYKPKFVEGIREILEQDFVLDPITEITVSNEPIRLYDLSVPASHSYVANGMVVHNSIVALNTAFNQYMKYKLSVCVIPLEMSQKEVRARLLSKLTGIPFTRFYKKELTKSDKKKAKEAWADFEQHGKDNGCFFSTWKPEACTVEELVFQLKPFRYDVVIVDYVNLMRSSDPKQMGSNDWQMLSSFYKQLKEAATTLNCLMVGLTQTNTEGGIKYSSAALEDCDCAITWKFLDAEQASHQIKAKVEVARNFAPFEFVLSEDFARMSVSTYAGPPPQSSAADDNSFGL